MARMIIFGGKSVESGISVITALQAAEYFTGAKLIYIDNDKWRLVKHGCMPADLSDPKFLEKCPEARLLTDGCIYIRRGWRWEKKFRAESVLNCCHGGAGENGELSGFLKTCGVLVINGGIVQQAVSMDKAVAKVFFRGLGLPVVEGMTVSKKEFAAEPRKTVDKICDEIGLPAVIKPVGGGSSIAVAPATDKEELYEALAAAFEFDITVLIERELKDFIEVNVAVYEKENGIECSLPEKPIRAGEILDFNDKYRVFGKGGGKREFPYETPFASEITKAAALIYKSLSGEGIMRADFLIEGDKWYINEINALPGSMSFYLFPDKNPSEMLEESEKVARAKAEEKEKLIYSYDAGEITGKK